MMGSLNQLRYSTLGWLLLPAVTLHNLEEWVALPLYGDVGMAIERRLGISMPVPPSSVFETALLLVTIVSVAIIVAGSVGAPSRFKTWLVCFVASIYLVNVFLPHLPTAFIIGGYAPGIVTALTINLPLCLLLLRQAKRERNMSATEVGVIVGLAAVTLPAIIPSVLATSSLLASGP